jgi:hypothetical protein
MFVGHTLKPRAFDFKKVIEHPEKMATAITTQEMTPSDDQNLKLQQVQYMKKLNFTLAHKKNEVGKKIMEY